MPRVPTTYSSRYSERSCSPLRRPTLSNWSREFAECWRLGKFGALALSKNLRVLSGSFGSVPTPRRAMKPCIDRATDAMS